MKINGLTILISLLITAIGCTSQRGLYTESKKLKLLHGAWFQVKEENGAFLIKNRSLIFFEDITQYNIELKGNSLEIYEGRNLFTTYQIVRLDDQTLWLKTIEGNVLKLINGK
jgi:hypothetical protein